MPRITGVSVVVELDSEDYNTHAVEEILGLVNAIRRIPGTNVEAYLADDTDDLPALRAHLEEQHS